MMGVDLRPDRSEVQHVGATKKMTLKSVSVPLAPEDRQSHSNKCQQDEGERGLATKPYVQLATRNPS